MSQEAVCIMMDLCDQEEMICSYVRSKEHDTKIETFSYGKLSIEEIATGFGLSIEEVKELPGLQLA